MKKTLLSLSIAAAAVTMPTQAADIGNGLDLSGNLALVSNYMWRGATASGNKPSIQGGFDLAHESGLYVGVWAASGDGADEIDYYGGYATEVAGFGLDVGYLNYTYPEAADFQEAYFGVSKELGAVELGVTQYWGMASANDNTEFSIGTEIGGFGLSAAYGDYDNAQEYYVVSVSKEVLSEKWPVELSLSYTESDSDSGSASDQDALVFAVAKSF
jgi:uncharacterized protein (TIGR02001 family)